MPQVIDMPLWVVTWRERETVNCWKQDDDGSYPINKPRKYKDSTGSYWRVALYAQTRMMAILDASGMINKEMNKYAN